MSADEPPFDCGSDSDRVNVWMRFRGQWVIHTKGATRYHASFHEDADHPVLPVGQRPGSNSTGGSRHD